MEALCHKSLDLCGHAYLVSDIITIRSICILFISVWLNLTSIGFQEDLFEGCHGDSVANNSELLHIVVECCEELLEMGRLLVADLKGDLLRSFRYFFDLSKELLQVRLDLSVSVTVSLDHGQFVT